MSELIFHIGMGKCGSTSIQTSLASLQNKSVEYIAYPGQYDSNPIIYELLEKSSICPQSVMDAVIRQGLNFKYINYIISRAQHSTTSKLIVSAEHVSWLLNKQESNKLVETLLLPASRWRKVHLVCYFRLPASSRYLSTLQEDAKYNSKIKLYLSDRPYSELKQIYSRWEAICKEHDFIWTPIKYHTDNLVNNNVVQDFYYRVGVECDSNAMINFKNKSLSPLSLAAIRRVAGVYLDSLPWRRKAELVKKLSILVDSICATEKIENTAPWKFVAPLEKYIDEISFGDLSLRFVNEDPAYSLPVARSGLYKEFDLLQIQRFGACGLNHENGYIHENGYLTGDLENFLEGIDRLKLYVISSALHKEVLEHFSKS